MRTIGRFCQLTIDFPNNDPSAESATADKKSVSKVYRLGDSPSAAHDASSAGVCTVQHIYTQATTTVARITRLARLSRPNGTNGVDSFEMLLRLPRHCFSVPATRITASRVSTHDTDDEQADTITEDRAYVQRARHVVGSFGSLSAQVTLSPDPASVASGNTVSGLNDSLERMIKRHLVAEIRASLRYVRSNTCARRVAISHRGDTRSPDRRDIFEERHDYARDEEYTSTGDASTRTARRAAVTTSQVTRIHNT